ncbi:DNA polymerase III subunit alpha [Streptomyces sp. NBC_01445]|uniref:DNA polymerase III subunit alpha n=1 Tax=Streptomyces sp. NBC_01445 TaxID=2903869 RepID=UPI002DD9AE71|nr:DNA polymerase III subunit alpha [Streptomyces sp. NBC_01445]WSE01967.1 DNA polymerase III subunit alpha [Streptomyces sp. NBC_01445]WSE10364.1 DNA polymerase III subunit alpha [Streptomyces sp. NBC_01445]WSE11070.1 DNA polymerase III subunit alpha [Streptomyces sp. NBC_01445]
MTASGFSHLHVASGYSARYGASLPHDLVRRAAERGLTTLALTDRDTVAGTVRFAKAAAAAGVRPIFGVDLAVAPAAEPDPAVGRRRTPVRGGAHVVEARWRVTLLAQDVGGWARLCRIVSAAHAAPVDGVPVAAWPVLQEHLGEGLVVLLGPASEPVAALMAGRQDLAERLLAQWRTIAGPGLRLETVYLGRSGTGAGSLRLAARTVQLGDDLSVPVVVSNSVRYADPAQHRLADVLDAARLLRPIDRRHVDSGEGWLKSGGEMAAVAARIAEAAGHGPERAAALLAETEATAASCTLSAQDLGMGRPHFPEPHVVGADRVRGGAMRLLRQRCEAGMVARGLDSDVAAVRQLDYELDVIGRLGFEGYFLAVAQVVADVRAMGVRVAARGSGAGSMVNHSLFVATANPLTHRLLFERFLSERRTSLPDIDLDVESARRLEVYDKIIERFGLDRVAVTGMPETYRARHALRDTGLALGIAPQTVDMIAKSFPHIRACDIRSALAELPELRQLAARADEFGPLWELAEGLDALVRGYAMHPCGVIISNVSLLDRLPVQPTPGGDYPMLQADKEDVEDLGLLKLDVLGVRMQSAMAHAVDEILRTTGRLLDLDNPDHVPLDDQATFEMIRRSDTLGCFQIESPGQMDLVGRLQPRHMQDVIADISLFRPGPVKGGMPAKFIAARHGAAPHYPHPDLQPILNDTYGVVIWHEQIIAILAKMTGCDRAAGDVARRALADPERLPAVEQWFKKAATERDYSDSVVDEVWDVIKEFGAYGFCRAHAVAFAVPAVQSAWLKAHHPAALYAGLLEHDPGMWPMRVIVADARRHGVPILPVDVSRSQVAHRVEATDRGWGVRLALSTVKGISDAESARIAAHQPYTSLQDFWQRARPSLPIAERLIQIGALDEVKGALTRRDLLLQAGELHRHARNRATADGQLALGGDLVSAEPSGLKEMSSRERMSAELDVLSIDVSQHLMEHHYRLLRELGATDAAHLQRMVPGQKVLVAGVRASTQTPPIPSGKRIIFVTLEDGAGLVDLAFFEDTHADCAHTIFHSGLLLVRGTVEARGPRRTVVGEMAWDLETVAAARRDHGPQAALDLLGHTTPAPTPAQSDASPAPASARTLADGTAGSELHPWADLQPAGSRSADLRRLGHRSPGSAG